MDGQYVSDTGDKGLHDSGQRRPGGFVTIQEYVKLKARVSAVQELAEGTGLAIFQKRFRPVDQRMMLLRKIRWNPTKTHKPTC